MTRVHHHTMPFYHLSCIVTRRNFHSP